MLLLWEIVVRCVHRQRNWSNDMTTSRPIDYAFAAAYGITLGCLLAAFI